MASNKRKTDEKHLKLLREMVALAHNKQCFDCHQRGPTYINMTIGSFVCTACSGQLRGLNPPNRVKSISMASFTQDEMDFVKSHGNEFCRKVWLGLYDNKLGSQSESREESKVKDFMANKYERKRWYVAPTEAMKEEARKMNESTTVTKATGTKPLKALLGQNTPALILGNSECNSRPGATFVDWPEIPIYAPCPEDMSLSLTLSTSQTSIMPTFANSADPDEPAHTEPSHQDLHLAFMQYLEKRSDFVETKQHKTATPPPIVHPVSNSPQLPSPTLQSPGNQSIQSSKSTGSTAMDLLGDLGGDPFASSAPPPTASGGFADFGNFAAPSTGPPAFAQNAPLHLGGTTGTAAPPVNGSFTAAQTNIAAMMGGDKYSHLQDLFSVEPSKTEAQPTTAVDWNGGQGVSWNSTVAPAGSTPSGGPIKWGGESNSSTNVGTGGVNWNSSSTTTATSVGGGAGWGGASSSGTGMSWNTPATVQSNVSNPFGGGTNTSLSTQPANTGAPNPFATQQQPQPGAAQGTGGFTQFGSAAPSAAGFGSFATSATTSAGFGQFPSSATTTSAGFGQFASNTSTTGGGFGQGQFTGSAAPSAGGFGQFSVQQNGGFSSATPTGAFGAAQTNTQAGFGQPATGFGGQQTGFPQQAAGFGAQGFGGQPGQPAQGFGQPAGGFGGQPQGFGAPQGAGWGQPAAGSSVNPFMSAASQPASAPKGSTTNPFL